MNEQVLVIPTDKLPVTLQEGLNTTDLTYLTHCILKSGELLYMDRAAAENDPSFKQIIPYVLLRDKSRHIFSYCRTKKGGEERLHNLRSLGVGGHINPVDGEGQDNQTYCRGLDRELNEEVGLRIHLFQAFTTVVGLINDNSNAVGKVHLGVVHLIAIDPAGIRTRDPALALGEFLPTWKINQQVDEYESWSQLIIKELL